jgi:hypothetical protein
MQQPFTYCGFHVLPGPIFKGSPCSPDRFIYIRRIAVGDVADNLASGGVTHFQRFTAYCSLPLAIDEVFMLCS